MKPGDDEVVVAIVLAIEEADKTETIGWRGMAFLAKEAARIIRELRPDLTFKEEE